MPRYFGTAIENNIPCDLRWRDKLSVENKGGSSCLLFFSVILRVTTNSSIPQSLQKVLFLTIRGQNCCTQHFLPREDQIYFKSMAFHQTYSQNLELPRAQRRNYDVLKKPWDIENSILTTEAKLVFLPVSATVPLYVLFQCCSMTPQTPSDF